MSDDSKKPERYRLGGEFGDEYLTRQEARCMVCLLGGKTAKSTAKIMELSPRTVEHYINNMKKKLSCCSKLDMVLRVMGAEFPYNVDLDPLTF